MSHYHPQDSVDTQDKSSYTPTSKNEVLIKYLLQFGELKSWFEDWEIIHEFEGIADNPKRAVAQIVCRKMT